MTKTLHDMKNYKFVLPALALILLITISCEKQSDEIRPVFNLGQPDFIDDENYEIYSLIINEGFTSEKIVIAQKSIDNIEVEYQIDFFEYIAENNPDFDTLLIENLNNLSQDSVLFDNKFTGDNKEIYLISSAEISYIFDSEDIDANWEEFYQEYENSNGIIRFSQIGFNEDKTQSVLEISYKYGTLGGEGYIIYLIKQNDNWVMKDMILTWLA